MPQLLSVQTGTVRPVVMQGRKVLTAIRKQAVVGPVPVWPLGLQGD